MDESKVQEKHLMFHFSTSQMLPDIDPQYNRLFSVKAETLKGWFESLQVRDWIIISLCDQKIINPHSKPEFITACIEKVNRFKGTLERMINEKKIEFVNDKFEFLVGEEEMILWQMSQIIISDNK